MGTRGDGATHTGDTDAALAVLRSVPAAAIIAFAGDLRGLLLAGEALADLGLSADLTPGGDLRELMPGERWEVWEPLCTRALRGNLASIDLDGTLDPSRLYRVQVGPWRDQHGAITGAVAIATDITDRRQATEALAAELEAFNYSVSHDLRAPLRAIDGFSAAVGRRHADALDATGRELLARIRRAVAKMGTLIDALLDLSRLSRREMSRDRVDLSAITRETIDELRARDTDRMVELVVEDGLTAVGDRDLLRIALENLLANAWKFTAGRERAVIEFAGESAGATTTFTVRDNGVGFDMTGAERLFAPFQRLHSDEQFPGLGIGLATVQRIIRRHGGTIDAESCGGDGATFRFDLPSAPEETR